MAPTSTATLADLEREIRRQLAGVFETTAAGLFVLLGGKFEDFDERAGALMEWHLRTHGYSERDVTPLCSKPTRKAWVRTSLWPNDRPWLEDDEDFLE